jgi:hypothetical protein
MKNRIELASSKMEMEMKKSDPKRYSSLLEDSTIPKAKAT